MTKFVYSFQEGNKDMRELLGGKGANLAEMTNIGLPVPRGFTVTTEACNQYYKDGETISSNVEEEIFSKLEELESITGKKLGDINNPLLVSVRSGSRASMPGMMDTVLNLGLNDEVAKGFADMVFIPRANAGNRPAMVVELKYDQSADSAINQIKERRYQGALSGYSDKILLVGVNYEADGEDKKKHTCVIEEW